MDRAGRLVVGQFLAGSRWHLGGRIWGGILRLEVANRRTISRIRRVMNDPENQASLLIIAGPCVIESSDLCSQIGAHVRKICDKLDLRYVFKASFDKANRSSNSSFRGPGLTEGLAVLERVKRELGVPVLTDIHEPDQAPTAA